VEPIFRHILVTTDFSEVADRALRVGFGLARQNEARVTLCHVLEYPPVPNPVYAQYVPVGKVTKEGERLVEERARGLLEDRVPEDLRGRVDLALPHGPPADEILRIAADRGVDLIVLSPHGNTGILDRFLGGVAYRVVRHARCPVLVVR
jgi:nucleotide-binding universal stress UspA family protein